MDGNPDVSGRLHAILIQYDHATGLLSAFFDDFYTPQLTAYVGRLKESLGEKAYFGFTSATGLKFTEQTVHLWEYIQCGLPGDDEHARYEFISDDFK